MQLTEEARNLIVAARAFMQQQLAGKDVRFAELKSKGNAAVWARLKPTPGSALAQQEREEAREKMQRRRQDTPIMTSRAEKTLVRQQKSAEVQAKREADKQEKRRTLEAAKPERKAEWTSQFP